MGRLVVLSLCAAVVLLSSLAASSAEDVIVLTPDNFDLEVGQSKGALVEFYAPWCDYSMELALEYEKLGTTLKKTKNVLIGKVDCHQYISLCSKYGISGYPTIKWFPAGSQDSKDYSGDRTVDALAEFVNTQADLVGMLSSGADGKLSSPASEVVELTPATRCMHGAVPARVLLRYTKKVPLPPRRKVLWLLPSVTLMALGNFVKDVKAFPTIKCFPKDKKEAVVGYDGDRFMKALVKVEFLQLRARRTPKKLN